MIRVFRKTGDERKRKPAPTYREERLVARLRKRVLLVVLALAVLAATMPGVAAATAKKHSSKNAGADIAVVGQGSAKGKGVDANGEKFKFSAKSTKGADATNRFPAKGKFSYKYPTGEFAQGNVTCLEVLSSGGTDAGANLAGRVTKSNKFLGAASEFDVYDSGFPKGQFDRFSKGFAEEAPSCIEPYGAGDDPITSGNITVHAA
jgi:hypothetical protein